MKAEHIEWLGSVFGGTDVLHAGDICDYFDVISDAFSIHVEKERIRDGLWKDYPAEDQANMIKVKVDRISRSLERMSGFKGEEAQPKELRENVTEELLDIINYAVFACRIVNGKA